MATVNYFFDNRLNEKKRSEFLKNKEFEKAKDSKLDIGKIKLRVTHNSIQKVYSTKIDISKTDFDNLRKIGRKLSNKITDRTKRYYHDLLFCEGKGTNIDEMEADFDNHGFIYRAEQIIKKLGINFDFEKFKNEFSNYGLSQQQIDNTNLIEILNAKCELLKSKGQISHGINFGLVAKSLNRFVSYLQLEDPERLKPKKNFILRFNHVDSEFLSDWAYWMAKQGKTAQKKEKQATAASQATISIYSRVLRTIFNDAIKNNIIDKSLYPFGGEGFKPPQGKNKKKSLKNKQIDQIKAYKPEPNTVEQRSHDFWLFSYFANGMNFTDLLHLEWRQIKGNELTYTRQKIKENPIEINAKINATMHEIIGRWSNSNRIENDLVFPFLNDVHGIEAQKKVIHQFVKITNKYMNKIGAKLGIEDNLTTYVARHSFSTRMMRNNAPINMIKEKLGHQKISTTESYLGSFEDEDYNKYADAL